jgi:hypothetical protein
MDRLVVDFLFFLKYNYYSTHGLSYIIERLKVLPKIQVFVMSRKVLCSEVCMHLMGLYKEHLY